MCAASPAHHSRPTRSRTTGRRFSVRYLQVASWGHGTLSAWGRSRDAQQRCKEARMPINCGSWNSRCAMVSGRCGPIARSTIQAGCRIRPRVGHHVRLAEQRVGLARPGPVSWSVEVVAERPGAGGVAQLGHCFGLDLSDPLSGEPVDLGDLVQGVWLAVG